MAHGLGHRTSASRRRYVGGWVAGASVALVAVSLFGPVAAQETGAADVDLQLVLAVDVSRSMDYGEQKVQRDGYVAAFRSKEVQDAIASGPLGRIAVTYVEWAGAFHQAVVLPWTLISGPEDADAFASRLETAPISQEMWTSISQGLRYAAAQFDVSIADSDRRTIDVSGDGANNEGLPVAPIRDQLIARGITINGLPIIIRPSGRSAYTSIPLDVYYEDCVIGGPGAFMVTIESAEEFPAAIRRKLVLEIAGLPPRIIPVAAAPKTPRIDCMIGEKTRPDF